MNFAENLPFFQKEYFRQKPCLIYSLDKEGAYRMKKTMIIHLQ